MGAPKARPPERSGVRGPRERRRWGVRRGEAPRLTIDQIAEIERQQHAAANAAG